MSWLCDDLVWDFTSEKRVIRIPNTLSLEKIMVSENLRAEVEKNPRLEIRGEPENFIFGEDGCLSSSIG